MLYLTVDRIFMKYKYLFLWRRTMKAMKVRLMLVMGYLGAVIGAGLPPGEIHTVAYDYTV